MLHVFKNVGNRVLFPACQSTKRNNKAAISLCSQQFFYISIGSRWHNNCRSIMTTSVSSFGGNYGNNSSNETNTFTILRNSFGQSGTINIVIDEPEIKKDGNVDTPENENKAYDNLENKVVVNTTWSDVVDIKLRSLNNNFNFNNNGSATVSLKESGSMENNSSQVDIQIHDYPTDEPFLLEINLPEHSNFSFISKIPNLSTDINVPNKFIKLFGKDRINIEIKEFLKITRFNRINDDYKKKYEDFIKIKKENNYKLADLYFYGIGVRMNHFKAKKLYQLCVEKGCKYSQEKLKLIGNFGNLKRECKQRDMKY